MILFPQHESRSPQKVLFLLYKTVCIGSEYPKNTLLHHFENKIILRCVLTEWSASPAVLHHHRFGPLSQLNFSINLVPGDGGYSEFAQGLAKHWLSAFCDSAAVTINDTDVQMTALSSCLLSNDSNVIQSN